MRCKQAGRRSSVGQSLSHTQITRIFQVPQCIVRHQPKSTITRPTCLTIVHHQPKVTITRPTCQTTRPTCQTCHGMHCTRTNSCCLPCSAQTAEALNQLSEYCVGAIGVSVCTRAHVLVCVHAWRVWLCQVLDNIYENDSGRVVERLSPSSEGLDDRRRSVGFRWPFPELEAPPLLS